jgi:hypothetical protein
VVDIFCLVGHSRLLWYHVDQRTSGRAMNILKKIPWAAVAAMAVFVAMGIVAHLFGK